MSDMEMSLPSSMVSQTAKQGPILCIDGKGPHTAATCSLSVLVHWLNGVSSTNKENNAVRKDDWGVTPGCFRTWEKSMLRTGISENCLLFASSFSVVVDTLRASSQKETPSFTYWLCGIPET